MPVSVDVKRAAFRQLYSSAVTAANTTLLAALATAIAPSLAAALAGKQVVEAQAQGVVTKYQLPAALAAQTEDMAAMWGQLQDLYDAAIASGLTAESQNLPHADGAAIYAYMMAQLVVVRAFSADHSQPNFR